MYTQVSDETVARGFYQAMAAVEERVALEAGPSSPDFTPWPRLPALLDQVMPDSRGSAEQVQMAQEIRPLITVAAERTARQSGYGTRQRSSAFS